MHNVKLLEQFYCQPQTYQFVYKDRFNLEDKDISYLVHSTTKEEIFIYFDGGAKPSISVYRIDFSLAIILGAGKCDEIIFAKINSNY